MNLKIIISIVAVGIAFFSLVFVFFQTRLLRKTIETNNQQQIIAKVFSARDSIIDNPELGEMFEENVELKQRLDKSGITVQEFFWILKYLSVWESFFYLRKGGVMPTETWIAYVATVKTGV